MKLGDFIKLYRKEHGLSLRQFANKCNMSHTYVSYIENNLNPSTGGPISPSVEMLRCFAKAMNLTTDDLIALVDSESDKDEANSFSKRIDTVSNRLQKALSLKDQSQSSLAKSTGISKSSISLYLSGKIVPNERTITKLAKALNVSDLWLEGFDVPMDPLPSAEALFPGDDEESVLKRKIINLTDRLTTEEQLRQVLDFNDVIIWSI